MANRRRLGNATVENEAARLRVIMGASPGGSAAWVPVSEIALGVIDGSNRVFTTRYAYKSGSLRVVLNGLRLSPAEYAEFLPATAQLAYPPTLGDILVFEYLK